MRAERLNKVRVGAGEVRAAARAPGWVMPAVKAALVAADALLAVACFVAAYVMREGGPVLLGFSLRGGFAWAPGFEPYGSLLWLVLVIRLVALGYYALYRLRGEFSYVDEAARVFKALSVASLLVVAGGLLFCRG